MARGLNSLAFGFNVELLIRDSRLSVDSSPAGGAGVESGEGAAALPPPLATAGATFIAVVAAPAVVEGAAGGGACCSLVEVGG